MSFSVFENFKNLKGFVFLTLYKIAFENLPSKTFSKIFSYSLLYLGVHVNWVRVEVKTQHGEAVLSFYLVGPREQNPVVTSGSVAAAFIPTELSHWPPGLQFLRLMVDIS